MLAIIPARGGSKGLPGKNVKLLNGKPLIAHTIEAALESKKITKIIISTDDDEIIDVCKKYNVEIPFVRPQELAQDDSLIVDTYLYTVARYNKENNTNYNAMIALLPTCPFRTGEDIDNAVEIFNSKNADSVISFYESPHPLMWYKKITSNGTLVPIFPEDEKLSNRQEEEKNYLPNGGIYIFKMSILEERKYYTDKTYPYIMPIERSVDIDNLHDFKMAEFMIHMMKG